MTNQADERAVRAENPESDFEWCYGGHAYRFEMYGTRPRLLFWSTFEGGRWMPEITGKALGALGAEAKQLKQRCAEWDALDVSGQLNAIQTEVERLRAENERLRAMVDQHRGDLAARSSEFEDKTKVLREENQQLRGQSGALADLLIDIWNRNIPIQVDHVRAALRAAGRLS